jgi:hypothetical protein
MGILLSDITLILLTISVKTYADVPVVFHEYANRPSKKQTNVPVLRCPASQESRLRLHNAAERSPSRGNRELQFQARERINSERPNIRSHSPDSLNTKQAPNSQIAAPILATCGLHVQTPQPSLDLPLQRSALCTIVAEAANRSDCRHEDHATILSRYS